MTDHCLDRAALQELQGLFELAPGAGLGTEEPQLTDDERAGQHAYGPVLEIADDHDGAASPDGAQALGQGERGGQVEDDVRRELPFANLAVEVTVLEDHDLVGDV